MANAGDKRHKVSVIITTKNRSKQLGQALDSVYSVKSPKLELEVIVIDDGSNDDTAEVVARYPARRIRTEGIGMAPARNVGLKAATGDFVTLLDDDDVWLPTNMVAQLDLFEQRPELGAVHAQSQLADFDMRPFGDPVPGGPL